MAMSETTIIPRRSLHDELATQMRDLLTRGELKAGDKISEQALCQRFGVSRTPLREALKVLANEGLVILLPNRGASVARISPEEIDELFPIMGALEALAGEAACSLLKEKGKAADAQAYILMGDLAHQASRDRTSSFKQALTSGDCKAVTIADEQSAAWTRTSAMDMTTNWITAGRPIDVVFANNDEMAIGAVQALKAASVSMDDVIVIGIDATPDGLASMAADDLDATVFQNAKGQSTSALDAAVALIRGTPVDKQVMVPFELVMRKNMTDYASRN